MTWVAWPGTDLDGRNTTQSVGDTGLSLYVSGVLEIENPTVFVEGAQLLRLHCEVGCTNASVAYLARDSSDEPLQPATEERD